MRSVLVAMAIGVVTACGSRPPLVACPAYPRPAPVVAPEVQASVANTGFTIASCTSEGSDYQMVRAGTRTASIDEVLAIHRRIAGRLVALEGVTGAGFGGCCITSTGSLPEEGCLGVAVDDGTPAATALASVLARVVDEDPAARDVIDGECLTCNTVCTSYRARPTTCTLILATSLSDAYCGCLEGACRWFRY
jgi:hypothetical protein